MDRPRSTFNVLLHMLCTLMVGLTVGFGIWFLGTAPTVRTSPTQIAIHARGNRTLYASPRQVNAFRVLLIVDMPCVAFVVIRSYKLYRMNL